MKSTSESGHAKNVAAFNELISYVSSFGAVYNPSNASLSLTGLNSLSTQAHDCIAAVNTALSGYNTAVAARAAAFEPLSKLATRIINSLKSSTSIDQIDENARSIIRKIQGVRATARKTTEEKEAAKAEGKEIKEVSSSQLSFDNRLVNFDKLIKLLSAISNYAPNEADLSIAGLTAYYESLSNSNNAVIEASTTLSNARLHRNETLYKTNSGLADVALAVKSYIKSLFGAGSPQYKQISKLSFKNLAQ